MEKHTKTAHFIGGPLDGQTKQIKDNAITYIHEQPPVSDDIHLGEVPVGFFPPVHEYIYHENPADSGSFVYTKQPH